jgi:hypothetical protein
MQELFAFIVVSVLIGLAAIIAQRRIGGPLGQLIVLGLLLRIVGATLRLEVIEHAYGGGSDSKSYFLYAKEYADRMANLEFGFVLGDEYSPNPQWWGTQFIRTVAAVVVFLVGENIRAAFLVFSCLSFAGQALIVDAFGNVFGRDNRHHLARWVWFWPSLWFWPSSIGKEALIMLSIGLVVWGYVGKRGAPDWRALVPGLALAAAIRPHVAMVFALCVAAAEFVRYRPQGSQGKLLRILVVAGLVALTLRLGLSQLGLDDADLEGIEEYFEHRAATTDQGGSRIGRAKGVLALPLALVNVFLRPFPWEARGIQILSAGETWFFWFIFLQNRRGIGPVLRAWRENRFLALAAPLGLSLAMLYGLAFANMGIIARQRIVVLPFLLVLLALPKVVQNSPAPAAARAPPFAARNNGRHGAIR